ncbi:signal peptidase I [Actinomadura barringtoniae]|uniref:Signal peptidase I n=1 Tax=Actinomadura barringtoniae TaxID=1427535 RepID=A0A939PMY0_9ACTN|nr:signal peptidase I [Actinomadura barringtoniae]MBO2455297.1 signal peptidase I [Actinomadura barringtoniae]
MRSEAEDTAPEEESAVASGDADDAPPSRGRRRKKQGSFWKELPVLIGVALALALLIKMFAVQAFYIPSGSMENTLQVGDRVLVNKIVFHTRDIKHGDVVVFNGVDSWDQSPEANVSKPSNPVSKFFHWLGSAFGIVPGEKDYIKRVIGVPGDRVKCCDAQGRVTVNGVPLDEKSYLYTDPQTGEQNKPSEIPFEVTVGKGELWVMGDHREVSYDSRNHREDPGGGTIPINRVIGRAFVIVWPFNHMGTLPIPKTFDQPGVNAALAPSAPFALGLVGATPVALLNRRRKRRRS